MEEIDTIISLKTKKNNYCEANKRRKSQFIKKCMTISITNFSIC